MIYLSRILGLLISLLFVSFGAVGETMALQPTSLAWVGSIETIRKGKDVRLLVKGSVPVEIGSAEKVRSSDQSFSIQDWSTKPRSDGGLDFEFRVASPRFEAGGYFPLAFEVEYEGGYRPLVFQSGEKLSIQVSLIKSRHWAMLAVVVLAIGLGFSKTFKVLCRRLGLWVESRQRRIAWCIGGFALVLVALGWTGSSWKFLSTTFAGRAFLEAEGSTLHWRKPQLDRWDEWGVITPGVLAQLNHQPRLPIVNTNLGPEGQNMGVMGMFGVPIAQPAALARPATWGYFVLPLRHAMSWQWQIQFWGCLLALWWFLNTLKSGQSGRNLALSTAFCVAPYAAGWSNWPLYASLFPLLGACLVAWLLRAQHVGRSMLAGVALGWVFAGWVLVLYPPWLVIVGSLCALLMLGWVLDHRGELKWGVAQWLALLCALLVAGGLLGSWWWDTRDAIAQVQTTVYPGGRQVELGGGAPVFWSLRGYLNLEAFANEIGPASSSPEISSYFFVPLAMIAVLVLGVLRSPQSSVHNQKFVEGENIPRSAPGSERDAAIPGVISGLRNSPRGRFSADLSRELPIQGTRGVWLGLTAFVAIYGWYSFVGFPLWLAQVTKWGVLTTNRMDLGLGLATVVLVCLLWRPSSAGRELPADMFNAVPNQDTRFRSYVEIGFGIVLALLSAMLAWWVLAHVGPDLMPHNPLPYRVAIALMCAAMAWWMWRRQVASLILAMLVMGLGASFTYAPISRAPKAMALSNAVMPFVMEDGKSRLAKTLVVDSDSVPAMILAATGVPVIDGPLYYPHKSLWQGMRLPADQWPTVNRYQHLTFVPTSDVEGPLYYRVTSPRMDAVTVFFHPESFDFRSTGAERVVSHETLAAALEKSSKLERMGAYRQYVWFRVK